MLLASKCEFVNQTSHYIRITSGVSRLWLRARTPELSYCYTLTVWGILTSTSCFHERQSQYPEKYPVVTVDENSAADEMPSTLRILYNWYTSKPILGMSYTYWEVGDFLRTFGNFLFQLNIYFMAIIFFWGPTFILSIVIYSKWSLFFFFFQRSIVKRHVNKGSGSFKNIS